MNKIPEDVMRAAHGVVGPLDVYVNREVADIVIERCASAIMAERERCAKLVEYGVRVSPAMRDVGNIAVTAAILAGEQP